MIRSVRTNEYSLDTNLQKVKVEIEGWKVKSFEQVIGKKRKIMERLNGIQRCFQRSDNYACLKNLKKILQMELNKIIKKEELIWSQRSILQ